MGIDSQFAINHFLRSNGLASLGEAGSLMGQLGYLVRDHAHFRALLNACEPEERGHMYEALAPNLRFPARPLHQYLSELARDAEVRQLPTIGEDGHFKPFRVAEIKTEPPSDAAIATEAVRDAIAKQRLHVVCGICTRQDWFRGLTKPDVIAELRAAGWRRGFKRRDDESGERDQIEVCPACVRERAPRRLVMRVPHA